MIKRLLLFAIVVLVSSGMARAAVCVTTNDTLISALHAPEPQHVARVPDRVAAVDRQLHSGTYAVIGLGDSIMQSWPQDLLSGVFRLPVLNAGIAGDNTFDLLSRLDNMDWSRQSPRVVVLIIGTNDGMAPPCQVYLRIRAIVGRARQLFPATQIIVTSILPRGADLMQRDSTIRTTNAALRQNAGRFGYTFLDAHDAFLCDHRPTCDLFVPPTDRHPTPNLHPTRKGYVLLSRILQQDLAGWHR